MFTSRAAKAGALYCTVVFAAGFVLSVVRMVWVAPLAGELVGVLLEAPILLAIAWVACDWVAERLDVSQRFLDRLVMGGAALAVLVCAEAIAAFLSGGHSLGDFSSRHGESAVLLGLLVQVAFAVFPMLHRRVDTN
jgi:hypothetical protein